MKYNHLVFISVGEDILIVVLKDVFENKKLLKKYHKIICPYVKVNWRNYYSCARMTNVCFDLMLFELEKKHDWEKFPVCYLKRFDNSEKPFIFAQWKALDGEDGSIVSGLGECSLVGFDHGFLTRIQGMSINEARNDDKIISGL